MPSQQMLLAAARAQRRAVAAPRSHVATHRQQTLSFANMLQSGGILAVRSASEAYLSMPHKCDACGMGFKTLQALRSHDSSSAHGHTLRLVAKKQQHQQWAAPTPQESSSRAASSSAAVQLSATPAPRSPARTARAPPKAMDAGSTSVGPGARPGAVTTGSTPEPLAIGGRSCGGYFGLPAATRAGSCDVARALRSAPAVRNVYLKPKRAARPPSTVRVEAAGAGAPLSAACATTTTSFYEASERGAAGGSDKDVEEVAMHAEGILLPHTRLPPANLALIDTTGPPRWSGQPLAVPPDGLCLAYTIIAAGNPHAWHAT
jgi:hypothetical protein